MRNETAKEERETEAASLTRDTRITFIHRSKGKKFSESRGHPRRFASKWRVYRRRFVKERHEDRMDPPVGNPAGLHGHT